LRVGVILVKNGREVKLWEVCSVAGIREEKARYQSSSQLTDIGGTIRVGQTSGNDNRVKDLQ
jgi:hypothetical protein